MQNKENMFPVQIGSYLSSDYLLVEKSLKGDLEAFNQLVLNYQDIAYNLAYRILGERAVAEDITQDAFLSAYLKLYTFRGGSFRAWLLRIVTNACYDEIRRWKRQPTVPLTPVDQNVEEIESPYWLEDTGKSPEEATLLNELSFTIQKCLDLLSADFKIVVVLVDIMGMSYLEAAEISGVPLGTIRSRLRRARERLRIYLKELMEIYPEEISTQDEILALESVHLN